VRHEVEGRVYKITPLPEVRKMKQLNDQMEDFMGGPWSALDSTLSMARYLFAVIGVVVVVGFVVGLVWGLV
jgi:hypothetical protein